MKTFRLDDITKLNKIDFMKMDVQGAELEIIKNGKSKLNECLAIQLEMSFSLFMKINLHLEMLTYI